MKEEEREFSLESSGVYLLAGGIDAESAADAVRFVLEQNLLGEQKHLSLIVSSDGGCVHSGFAVIDAVAGSRVPVRTVGLGMIASMGLMIFLAGERGGRVLTPNTLVMSHQWSGVNWGKEHELLAFARANTIVSKMIVKHYQKYTGLSERDVKKYLLPANDVYLTAREAQKLGICDQVRELE